MDKLHLKAPNCWINDPNGFIYYQGKYHLFYQCFPYALQWGRMHWGHAVSEDLVHWSHLGIALYPSKYPDRDGCFSGSAIEDRGKLYLYYTGVRYLAENHEDINCCLEDQFVSTQMRICSQDGIHFDNITDKKVIIPQLENPLVGSATHTRDPKVWRGEKAWYLVIGSATGAGGGRLLFYKSCDLDRWTFVNYVERGKEWGRIWECPDYFELHGHKVLCLSLVGISIGGEIQDQSVCTLVDFQEESCRMTIPEHYQFMDYGLDLYAFQSTLDEQGRRILIGWARMPEIVDGSWIGMFGIPRVVEVQDGHIYFRPHPNVNLGFKKIISDRRGLSLAGCKVVTDLEDGETIGIGGYEISRNGRRVCTDRSRVFCSQSGCRLYCETPELREGFHVEAYVDHNLIEVFINNGEYVITNVVYGLSDLVMGGRKLEVYSLQTEDVSL